MRPAADEEQRVPRDPQSWQPGLWRYGVVMALGLALAVYWATSAQSPTQLTYTQFKQSVRDDRVTEVVFDGQQIRGRRAPAQSASAGAKTPSGAAAGAETANGGTQTGGGAGESRPFVTTRPPVDDSELLGLLESHDVTIRAEQTGGAWWLRALLFVAPWLLIMGLIFYGSRKVQERMTQGGGMLGFGKSQAKRYQRTESRTGFDDVAGDEAAKRDLGEIVGYLKEPDRYSALGAKIPRGVLLMGPPGTGKTLLARAVAGEAEAPFYSISGSEFIELFIGVGAARVRDMFESAKREAPAIVFIDEIDSIGRARGTGLGGGHDEREQTLNQILDEMDGFGASEPVVVLAATNRPDVLDPALLRPGRFDRKIALELPHKEARAAILEIHTHNVPLADDVDLARVASLTIGFSGADLENLANEATLQAGRRGQRAVDMKAFLTARDRIVLGAERELTLDEHERRVIAYHEAGHALAASLLPNADPPDKVTIVPRGRALGATDQMPVGERHNLQESYLRDRLGVMLAGRSAERVVFGETSSGAEQDLKQATQAARRMLTQWGMSGKLGPVAFHRGEEHVFLGREMTQARDWSEATAELIDTELRELLAGIAEQVEGLLTEHRAALDALVAELVEQETVERERIARIIEKQASAGPAARRSA